MIKLLDLSNQSGLTQQEIVKRAKFLGLKKRVSWWFFTKNEAFEITSLSVKKSEQVSFYFSLDGEFLIIESKMNKQ